jgi:beta-glucanase (GH16 family)
MNNPRYLLCFCLLASLLFGCQPDAPTSDPLADPANTATTAASSPVAAPALTDSGDGFAPAGFRVIWSDEFNTPGLPDTTKWGYQTGGFGWTAKELQLYNDADTKNVRVSGGMLKIIALEEKTKGNKYTSTRLVTKNKALFRQGYFEIRAKFPAGEGLRSAWWMVGDTVSKIGWPNAGEIDLVEHYGKVPNMIGGAVQTTENAWTLEGGKAQKGGALAMPTATTEFHVYGCLWRDQDITFYADGQPYYTYQPTFTKPETSWPFNWPFYMAFNLSVGGIRNQQSNNIAPDIFPAEFQIDYVRVYQPEQ